MACAFGVAVATSLQHVVKRPLLVGDDFVIPGFKEETWAEALGLNR